MKRFMIRGNAGRGGERGQMLPLVALSAAVLIALIGLSIDLGFAYVTKARLSKACDAAALAGMENINLGTTTAASIALAEFYANYATNKQTTLDKATVTPTFTFSPNSSAATQLTVNAHTTIQTFFIKVLPAIGGAQWDGVTAADSSVVSRGRLDFTLVLDKSSSLVPPPNGNGGQTEMYPAVTNFLSFFSDTLDKAALVTFANNATINVAMMNNFTAPINAATKTIYVNGTGFGGSTDSPDGLTNALAIENAQPWPNTSNLVKAAIFFTDGLANTIQDTLNCSPPSSMGATNLLFGGTDPNTAWANCIWFFEPGTGTNLGTRSAGSGCVGTYCANATSFASLHGAGGTLTMTPDNIRQEADDRCIQWASDMRANQIVVCTIGLGSDVDSSFLQIVANDPAFPGLTPTPYDGIYVTATNATDMLPAFQTVAETLLLRLIH